MPTRRYAGILPVVTTALPMATKVMMPDRAGMRVQGWGCLINFKQVIKSLFGIGLGPGAMDFYLVLCIYYQYFSLTKLKTLNSSKP
jgi:hypothetical protein